MTMTNTQKRAKETELLKELHPNVKAKVFADKKEFYDKSGNNLADKYELIVKTTEEQVRGLKGKTALELHEMENGRFFFTFFESSRLIQDRFPSLTPQDIARLMFIGTYVAWETNRLQSDNGKKVYRKKDIAELVEMSPKRFNELYKRYITEGVLIEGEDGELFLNHTVIYRGTINKLGKAVEGLSHTRVFRRTVRELYAQFKGRKLGQLATVYSIMPFLNFDYNIVCYNPEETASKAVKPMNLSVLADVLGYQNATNLKRVLNGIKVDGQPVFNFVEDVNDRREKRIIVNPKVIFAGDGEALAALVPLFN